MKKFLLAISFVFAFAVVASAQTKKTAADDAPPATEKAEPGDNGYVAPASTAPVSVNKNEKNNTANKTAATKKSCSKAKECKKGKSCCKKGAKATAAKKEKKACCKNKAKACGEKKKEEAKAEASTEATPVPAVKASEQ